MNQSNAFPSGHAYCTSCGVAFDLVSAKPTFGLRFPPLDSLIFTLCETCDHDFYTCSLPKQRKTQLACWRAFTNGWQPKVGVQGEWAVIPLTEYLWHDSELVKALARRNDLSPEEYKKLSANEYLIIALPGEIRLIAKANDKGGEHAGL
jgi:hypothetical protein